MLNSLLDFFRLDSGKEQANVRPFRLENIAELLQTEFTQQAEAKDLKLTIECPEGIILNGDKERIIQICDNLLGNAVKFTNAGSVSLVISYDGNRLTLVVEDTGTGMSAEEQQRVFGAFERLSNAATQDGFGLGLSIVETDSRDAWRHYTLGKRKRRRQSFYCGVANEHCRYWY